MSINPYIPFESKLLDGTIVWHVQDDIGVQRSLILDAEDAIKKANKTIEQLEGMLPKGVVWWCIKVVTEDDIGMRVYSAFDDLDHVGEWHQCIKQHMEFYITESFEVTQDEYELHRLDKGTTLFEQTIFERVMPNFPKSGDVDEVTGLVMP